MHRPELQISGIFSTYIRFRIHVSTHGSMITLKLDFLLLFSPLPICDVLLKPLTSNLEIVVTRDQRPWPCVPQLQGLILSPTSTHDVLKRNVSLRNCYCQFYVFKLFIQSIEWLRRILVSLISKVIGMLIQKYFGYSLTIISFFLLVITTANSNLFRILNCKIIWNILDNIFLTLSVHY